MRDLLDAALELVPALGAASMKQSWSSFRPYKQDELTLLSPKSSISGLLLASGHYRNGILLAPITAAIVLALVQGKRSPRLPLAAFALDRALR